MILPFGLLLAAIALAPLLFGAWWAKHYAKVVFGLGAVTVAYYCLGLHAGQRVPGRASRRIQAEISHNLLTMSSKEQGRAAAAVQQNAVLEAALASIGDLVDCTPSLLSGAAEGQRLR